MSDEANETTTTEIQPQGGTGAAEVTSASQKWLESLPADQREGWNAGVDATASDDADEGDDEKAEALEDTSVGRKRGPDGKFVADEGAESEDEMEGAEDAEAATDETEDAEAATDEQSAATVKLPGMAERGEDELEIEVSDPAVAERLRRLANDGLRRAAYDEKIAAVEERETELRTAEELIEANPVGFVLGMMTPERQLEVAQALVTEHFESLRPIVERFMEDEAHVLREKVVLRDRTNNDRADAEGVVARRQAARAIMGAAQRLVPEDMDHGTASEFLKDAERDLVDAARSGQAVTPDTVPQLLAKRIRMYGFSAGEMKGTAQSKTTAIARPVSDRAKAIAERKVQVADSQKRVQRVQAQRKVAKAVPGPGAGAATVRTPLVPKGASIEDASRILREKGGSSWANYNQSAG